MIKLKIVRFYTFWKIARNILSRTAKNLSEILNPCLRLVEKTPHSSKQPARKTYIWIPRKLAPHFSRCLYLSECSLRVADVCSMGKKCHILLILSSYKNFVEKKVGFLYNLFIFRFINSDLPVYKLWKFFVRVKNYPN